MSSSCPVNEVGAGNRYGGALGAQYLCRGQSDLVHGDRFEKRWKPPIVIQPKAELFAALKESGNAVVGFEQPRNRSDQVRARFLDFEPCWAAFAELAHFRIDRLDRTLDVFWIDAGPDDERPLSKGWIE